MSNNDKIIVAIDTMKTGEAYARIQSLGGKATFFKLGLELLTDGCYFGVAQYLRQIKAKIMFDWKLYGTPETIRNTVKALVDYDPTFITVHPDFSVVEAAVNSCPTAGSKILVVTVLTSTGEAFNGKYKSDDRIKKEVLKRARAAYQIGAAGVVCSGYEAGAIRDAIDDPDFEIVCPGIRYNEKCDDQTRIVTPYNAIKNGASRIVVGRPLFDSQTNISNPATRYNRMLAEIAKA